MPTKTVTGSLRTHLGITMSVEREVELWFRPNDSNVSDGLVIGVPVQATLNRSNGIFSVELEVAPWITYTPFVTWLKNPRDPSILARGEAEWMWSFNPYPNGGQIDELAGDVLSTFSVLVSLTLPPDYQGWYLNAPGPGQPVGDPDDPASSGTGILEIVS